MNKGVDFKKVYFKTFKNPKAILISNNFIKNFNIIMEDGLLKGALFCINKNFEQREDIFDLNISGFNAFFEGMDNSSKVANIDANCYFTQEKVVLDKGYIPQEKIENDFVLKMINSKGDVLILFAPNGDFSEIEGSIKELEEYNIPIDFKVKGS